MCFLTADGPYCEWEVKRDSFGVSPDEFDSFPAYREHLTRVCDNANLSPGILLWTPDEYTPDVVYYQVNGTAPPTVWFMTT